MNKFQYYFQLSLIIALAIGITLGAPTERNSNAALNNEISSEQNEEIDLTSEIKAGLDLVKLLPSMALPRKVTEAVVVLKQALESPNARLRSAFENAINKVKYDSADENKITRRLQSFLMNLKHELSSRDSPFPEAFAQWMKNQLTVVELTVDFNSERLGRLMRSTETETISQTLDIFTERIQSLQLFILRGLEIMKGQPTFKYNIDTLAIRNLIANGKYDRFVAAIILDHEVDYDENYDVDATLDITFIQALQELHKRASPDFQPTLIAILRGMEQFFKGLEPSEYFNFLQQLGTWNSFATSIQNLH